VARSYPLADARAAYDHLVTGHAGGKVVLEV
jgi:NADPH:quinone reductase-like Zn-dependent oxidoreductase